MRNTNVKMRDGRTYSAPIWEWRPEEGYFTIIDNEYENGGSPIRIEISEVVEATTLGLWSAADYASGTLKVRDELARARATGWNP